MADEGLPTRPIGRILRGAFSVALVCTLLVGTAGTSALLVVVRGFEQVASLQVPLVAVNDDLLQALTDAETSERGFLITGEQEFLDPYEPARVQFQRTLETAEDLADMTN